MLPEAPAPVAALEVRGVRKAVRNGHHAHPGGPPADGADVCESEALPVHTWLPRLTSERNQRRIDVWGFAERRRIDYHSSIESHSVRVDIHWCPSSQQWPDATLALGSPGCLWTAALPKSAAAAARGLLSVHADTQEPSLDLHELFDPYKIAAPTDTDALIHIRATVLRSDEALAGDRNTRRVTLLDADGRALPCLLSLRWDDRRDPLDPARMAERYMLVTLALGAEVDPRTVPDVAAVLRSALHHFAAHEVLVRAALAVNDDLSRLIRDLLDDETELHRVDNIKRDIAHLQREFTDELEAAWAFEAKLGGRAKPLLEALDASTDVTTRWTSQRKRFDRLASIADFAPTVGPPVAGPRDYIGGGRVGGAAAGQIRLERRMSRQATMAYSRWWQGRELHDAGGDVDPESRRAVLGPVWSRVYERCEGLDRRIRARQETRAHEEQRETNNGNGRGRLPERGGRKLLSSRTLAVDAHRPRLIELHPFRNRCYLFEELNGAIQRTTFLAAATLVFLGAVLQTEGARAVSDVDLLLIFLAIFGFLFSTLMFGRLTTRLARRTTIDYDGRFRTADRVSDYLGVFPLLLALPLIIFRFVDTDGLQLATAALALVATGFHLRLSSRLHIDVADNALSTSAFRTGLSVMILAIMAVALLAAIGHVPGAWLTAFVSAFVTILVFLTVVSGIVPPWSDDVHYGEVPAMRDGRYAVHPWDALSEESPNYYRRTFGSDYQGEPVGQED